METIFLLTNDGKLADYPAFRSRTDAQNFIKGLGSNGVSLMIKEVKLWPLKTDDLVDIEDADAEEGTCYIPVGSPEMKALQREKNRAMFRLLNKLDDDGETH